MSGKFTGLGYDEQAYTEKLTRSTDPLMYRLDPTYAVNCNQCHAAYGLNNPTAANTPSQVGDKIDVDSVLRGITKIHSKSNAQQMPHELPKTQTKPLTDCSDALESEYSRFVTPAYDIRGLSTDDLRLSYPMHDPQCQIFENFAVNTRLQAKDNHRTIWQAPMNQRGLLPTERLGRIKNCTVSMNCTYAPYNP